jgi:plasmid stability protein
MGDLLIRNVPEELHALLKQVAKVQRRSVAQQSIEILRRGLAGLQDGGLPPLIIPQGEPVTMDDLVRWADQDLETRGHP